MIPYKSRNHRLQTYNQINMILFFSVFFDNYHIKTYSRLFDISYPLGYEKSNIYATE